SKTGKLGKLTSLPLMLKERESPVRPTAQEPDERRSPWLSGSFYLVAFVVAVATCAAVGYSLSWVAVPGVLTTSVLVVSVLGALQLRHDGRLKEKSFLSLMVETFRQLSLVRGSSPGRSTRASLPAARPAAKWALANPQSDAAPPLPQAEGEASEPR